MEGVYPSPKITFLCTVLIQTDTEANGLFIVELCQNIQESQYQNYFPHLKFLLFFSDLTMCVYIYIYSYFLIIIKSIII